MALLTLLLQVFEEEGVFVSHCPQLDVSSQGDSPEEALPMLLEAIDIHLEEAKKSGYLDEVISEAQRMKFIEAKALELQIG